MTSRSIPLLRLTPFLRLARRTSLVGAMILALAAVGSLSGATAASVATATPASTTSTTSTGVECAPDNARVKGGTDGSDPNDVSPSQSAALEKVVINRLRAKRLSSRSLAAVPPVTIDVHVHVIVRSNGTGGVTRSRIDRQISVLNRAFAGRTAGRTARTNFRFALRSVDVTQNSDWYNWSSPDVDDDDDVEAKGALHRGGLDDLNIYLAGLQDDLLGYATFPFATTLQRDGVVLLNESLPGGAAAPYNRGDTATHEVGHWLGLYHTFENGCAAPGDQVSDTPYQDDGDNIFQCRGSLDTCSQPGRDPVRNFMSYADDSCLDRFSAGQAQRMASVWFGFRSTTPLP